MTTQNKNYFAVFYDVFNSLKLLPDEDLGFIFRAMFEYQIDNMEPKVTECNQNLGLKIAWATVKAMLDRHNEFRNTQAAKRGRAREVTKGNKREQRVTPSPNPNPNPNPKKEKKEYIYYGEYKKVKLTSEEYKQLVRILTSEESLKSWIKKLDEYLELNHKKKYDNHALVIKRWHRKENPSPTPSRTQPMVRAEDLD